MNIQISIRDRASLLGDSMREVKVWVAPLPVDYSYGTRGPDHGPFKGGGLDCAQSGVEVVAGDEDSGAVSAYANLLREYSNEETLDYETVCVRKYNIPWPGAWIKQIPHDYPKMHTVEFSMGEEGKENIKIL